MRYMLVVLCLLVLLSSTALALEEKNLKYNPGPKIKDSPLPSVSSVSIILMVICSGIYITFYFVKKFLVRRGVITSERHIILKDTLYLGPRKAVHAIEAYGRILMIGVTQDRISLISEWDIPVKDQSDFTNIISSKLSQNEGGSGNEKDVSNN